MVSVSRLQYLLARRYHKSIGRLYLSIFYNSETNLTEQLSTSKRQLTFNSEIWAPAQKDEHDSRDIELSVADAPFKIFSLELAGKKPWKAYEP